MAEQAKRGDDDSTQESPGGAGQPLSEVPADALYDDGRSLCEPGGDARLPGDRPAAILEKYGAVLHGRFPLSRKQLGMLRKIPGLSDLLERLLESGKPQTTSCVLTISADAAFTRKQGRRGVKKQHRYCAAMLRIEIDVNT